MTSFADGTVDGLTLEDAGPLVINGYELHKWGEPPSIASAYGHLFALGDPKKMCFASVQTNATLPIISCGL